MSRRLRWCDRLAVLVGASMIVAIVATAPAAATPANPTRDNIYTTLGVDRVPADYVILVDTSGSMADENLYGGVRSTLAAFLHGLTPADHIALYTFDNRPVPRYLGKATDPSKIVSTLPAGPTKNGATDIGAAINVALNQLELPSASKVASVVLLTDGKQDPPSGSPYSPDGKGPAWQALHARAARLTGIDLQGYALSLRGHTGAGLLQQVIPQTTVLNPTSIGQLGTFLDEAKNSVRLAKAKLALAGDIGKGVSATWSAPAGVHHGTGPVTIHLTLRSDTVNVPLDITGLGVSTRGAAVLHSDVPAALSLAPGEPQTYAITLQWRPKAWLVPFHDNRSSTFPLILTGNVTSSWTAPLQPDIDLRVPAHVQTSRRVVPMSVLVGTWVAQIVVASVVVVIIIVIWVLLYRRLREPLTGQLVVVEPFGGTALATFQLHRRGMRLRSSNLPGRAKIRARKTDVEFRNPDGREFVLSYERDGQKDRSRLNPASSVWINGFVFEHRPPDWVAPPPDPVVTPAADPVIASQPDPVVAPQPDPVVTPAANPVVAPQPDPVVTPAAPLAPSVMPDI